MLKKLKEIAEVQIGYQHREKVHPEESGSHQLVQVKDVELAASYRDHFPPTSSWRLWTGNLDRITPRADPGRYRLKPGDILFISRGPKNIAVPLVDECVQPYPESWESLIAAYTFYIIQPRTGKVIPEYLAWYINQPRTQAMIATLTRGSATKMLPKASFDNLEIILPPLSLQKWVITLDKLLSQEEDCMAKLIEKRRQLVQETSLRVITGQLKIKEEGDDTSN